MATLYKRANPIQARVLRIIEGAVKNAADAHGVELPPRFARSIAKRAAGTLTAVWPDVLAATVTPSDKVGVSLLKGDQPQSPQGSKGDERGPLTATISGPHPDVTKPIPDALPCPFCRSTNIVNWLSHDAKPNVWTVFCQDCEAEGPHSEGDEKRAIDLWNGPLRIRSSRARYGQ